MLIRILLQKPNNIYLNEKINLGGSMDFKRLYELREEYELTQEELAKILGVSRAVISQWELGRSFIPLKRLNIIANYYNLSFDYLMGLSNKKTIKIKKFDLNPKLIGERIFKVRKDNGLSLRDLAKIINTTPSTIWAYEHGKTLIITPFAYQICLNYKISMDWLCGRVD